MKKGEAIHRETSREELIALIITLVIALIVALLVAFLGIALIVAFLIAFLGVTFIIAFLGIAFVIAFLGIAFIIATFLSITFVGIASIATFFVATLFVTTLVVRLVGDRHARELLIRSVVGDRRGGLRSHEGLCGSVAALNVRVGHATTVDHIGTLGGVQSTRGKGTTGGLPM